MTPSDIHEAETIILAYVQAQYKQAAALVQAERMKPMKSFSYSDNLKRMGELQVVLNELNQGLVQKSFTD